MRPSTYLEIVCIHSRQIPEEQKFTGERCDITLGLYYSLQDPNVTVTLCIVSSRVCGCVCGYVGVKVDYCGFTGDFSQLLSEKILSRRPQRALKMSSQSK